MTPSENSATVSPCFSCRSPLLEICIVISPRKGVASCLLSCPASLGGANNPQRWREIHAFGKNYHSSYHESRKMHMRWKATSISEKTGLHWELWEETRRQGWDPTQWIVKQQSSARKKTNSSIKMGKVPLGLLWVLWSDWHLFKFNSSPAAQSV